MRILVFGGTGRVGSRVLSYAAEAGHQVRAYVRDRGRLPVIAGLEVVEGDIEDDEEIALALKGCDAVVSALGVRSITQPITLLSDTAVLLTMLMAEHGPRRLVWVAGAGILQADVERLKKQEPGFPPFLAPISDEHERVWRILADSELEWTLVCPPTMIERVRTAHYRLEANHHPPGGQQISFEDVADFIVRELEEPQFLHQRVGIAY
ncbi:MAG: NAD(P)-dependent oxidoreductase [Candidatus Sericytochromatia bacterium]